jgi:hypothetical protein
MDEQIEDRDAVEPAEEPAEEPFDPHTGPLDDDEDGRFLEENDPRRIEAEARLGRRFADETDEEREEHHRRRHLFHRHNDDEEE